MITSEKRKALIRTFIEEVKKEEFIPQFCHNLKSNKSTVYYGGPLYDDEEIVEALDTFLFGKWLASGEKVAKFEIEFSKVINLKYSLMVNSGSSANLVMLAAFKKYYKLEQDDEVIISVVGFPTSLAPIIQCGLTPVFVDIEFATLNFNLDEVIRNITNKTKAILLSPVLGNPPDMAKLLEICERRGIHLLVDGCDSLGSKWDDKNLAEFGELASCSFYPAHHITSLPYEETILLKSPDGKIMLKEIGDFVDNFDFSEWQCVSFDKIGKLEWKKITGVVSHPFTDKHLFKITTQTGKSCVVTGNHSLFKFDDKNGTISQINAEKLEIGNFIVVPNKIPNVEGDIILDITNYKKGSWVPYTQKMYLDEDLSFLLGWFVAEGSFHHSKSGNYNLVYTLNKSEYDIGIKLLEILKNKFSVSGKIYFKGENSISIQFSSKCVYKFFEENCGIGAKNKHIPEFIFRSKNNIKWKFLEAYFSGDGTHHIIEKSSSNSFDCKTVSKQLSEEIYYLLLMLGINPRYSCYDSCIKKIHNNKKDSIISKCYLVCYNKNLKSIVDSESFRSSSKFDFCRTKNDLTMLKITKIEKVDYLRKNVYDLSVNGYENFVSGIGFVVHNTGEGGMVSSNNEELINLARSFAWWGRDCYCVGQNNLLKNGTCNCRFKQWIDELPYPIDHKYFYTTVGYNLKPLDLQGALGLVQLKKLDMIHDLRKKYKDEIQNILSSVKGIRFPTWYPRAEVSWFGVPVICDSMGVKTKLVNYLENNRIQTRNYFAGNILVHPGFKEFGNWKDYPNANQVLERVFFIGCSPTMTDENIDYIRKVVNDYV